MSSCTGNHTQYRLLLRVSWERVVTQRASHPRPQDSHADLLGYIWGSSLWNFRCINSLQKSSGKEGELSMSIFPLAFPIEPLRIVPHENFSHISLQPSKCNISIKEGSHWFENIPVMISCHSLVN